MHTKLHEDLFPYLDFDEKLMMETLKHPLVFAIPYAKELNEHYNKQYIFKRDRIKEDIQCNNWFRAMALYEKPYRVNFIDQYKEKIQDYIYWPLLKDAWLSCEYPYQTKHIWSRLFHVKSDYNRLFMNSEDRKIFANLPDKVKVHRGYKTKEYKEGFSYSLSYEVAAFFADRFGVRGYVDTKVVDKKEIFAYTNERSEQEIIILGN